MKKTIAVFIVSCSFLFFISSVSAEDLFITSITADKEKSYSVTFNNVFTVNNISLKNVNNIKAADFPSYVSKGNIYKQFGVLSRSYGEYIAGSVAENKTMRFSGETGFEINKFSKLNGHKNIAAFASVIFEGKLEVECRIMRGEKGLWIAWPASLKEGKWRPDFIFTDRDLKNRVEDELIRVYNKNDE